MLETVAKELAQARDRLLDLGLRNRLTNFTPTRRTSIRIVDEVPAEVWRLLVAEERTLSFLAREEHELLREQESHSDSREHDGRPGAANGEEEGEGPTFELPAPATALEGEGPLADRYTDRFLQTDLTTRGLQASLLRTAQYAQSALDETGVNVLFLAFGMLYWRRPHQPERVLQAPLVFVPVALQRVSAGNRFNVKILGDDPVLNPCMDAILQRDFRVTMPTAPDDWSGFDIEHFFDDIRQKVARLPDWHVEPDMWLGLFSFAKYLMYVDLDPARWPEDKPLTGRPLVRVMCGDQDALGHPEGVFPDPRELDELVKPQDTYCVLDADSTQLRAIMTARSGRSFVIVGPPGTGKSQTIANMIAECLSAGKTVLFVSEKMAALEVVKRRLDNVGLGDFCLELHSTKTSRKAVLQQLASALEKGRKEAPKDDGAFSDLISLRERLNAYVGALHTPLSPSGLTPYCSMGKVAGMAETKDVICQVPGLLGWNQAQLLQQQQKVAHLARQLAGVWPVSSSPWRGVRIKSVTAQLQRDVVDALGRLSDLLLAVRKSARTLSLLVGAPPATTMGQARGALREGSVLAACAGILALADDRWDAAPADVRRLVSTLASLEKQRQWVAERYDLASADAVNWRAILPRWRTYETNLLSFLLPRYWRDRKAIRQCRKAGHRAGGTELLRDLDCLAQYHDTREKVEASRSVGDRYFGPFWKGSATEYGCIATLGNHLLAVRHWLRSGRVSDAAVAQVARGDVGELRSAVQTLRMHLEEWDAAWQRLCAHLALDEDEAFDGGVAAVSVEDLARRLESMRAAAEHLHEWARYREAVEVCQESGLFELLQEAARASLEPPEYPEAAAKLFYRLLAEAVTNERPELRRFNRADHEADRRRFADADSDLIKQNSYRLYALLSQKRPSADAGPQVSAARGSQLGILLGEIARKRGGRSIRRFLGDAPDVVLSLKPCFMMSPLSVAQFLEPRGMAFDLVVFDEASQVQPEDALGAFARADQTILVGDPKQLPPTSFFMGTIGEEGEDEVDGSASLADMESILDRGWMVLPRTSLRWHYRSRHESLIAFSNQEFYDGDLVLFPSSHRDGGALGISIEYHPEDWYDRGGSGTNRAQAARIAEWVLGHAKEVPAETLGVGAFSQRQQQAILDEVEKLRRLDASAEEFFSRDKAEPFFVKNLETIQGDERDVILLSVGYGKTGPQDRLSMNFGPLNQDGGWRRLNVLVTRARKRCVVFASIRPEDFDLSSTQARGVQALWGYLRYAFDGDLPEAPRVGGEFQSDFERAVFQALRKEGVEVHAQVGCAGYAIDLAVVDPQEPGRYVLGIECDGMTYHSSATARDRDRLRQQVLEGLGWRIHRVWSTDWFRTPKRELSLLLQAIEAARGMLWSVVAAPTRIAPARDPSEVLKRSAPAQENAAFVPYQKCQLKTSGPSEGFYASAALVQRNVLEVVKVEGPIHEDELTRRVARAWGINRAGSRVSAVIQRAVQAAAKVGDVRKDGPFLWPVDMQQPQVRERADDDPKDIDLVCGEELGRAACLIARLQFGIAQNDLVVQVARRMGFSSTGSKVRAAIVDAIEREKREGRLVEEQGMLKAAKQE